MVRYTLYAIKIDSKDFCLYNTNLNEVFEYCERKFGFNGKEWEEAKEDYDTEFLREKLEEINVGYGEYDDD